MWANVFLIGLAINLEPTRIGLIPLLLGRNKPIQHIITFVAANLSISLVLSSVILFFFQNNLYTQKQIGSPHSQLILGVLLIFSASILMIHWYSQHGEKYKYSLNSTFEKKLSSSVFARILNFLKISFLTTDSLWITAFIGIAMGLPSIESIAVILVIASYNSQPTEQIAALISFIIAGNLVVFIPLFSYWIFPTGTHKILEKLNLKIKSISQIKYAGILGSIGVILTALAFL